MNYYPHHIGDYRSATAHLSLLEHGAYRQLLDWYYMDESPIPKETDSVFRRLCARTEEDKSAVLVVLNEFFILTESGWEHSRCEREILAYQGKAERARDNGKLGGRPPKTKVVISGNQDETQKKANQEPITNNQEPKTKNQKPKVKNSRAKTLLCPPDVEQQVWDDYMAIRKAKKSPMTETALKNLRKESEKAGITINLAIQECVTRGWQGFKADWFAKQSTPQKKAPAPDNFNGKDYGEGGLL